MSGALFIAPAAPCPRAVEDSHWNILKQVLAGFLVASFYCVNRGIRRNVFFFLILPNQFLLGNVPWDSQGVPANKLDPQCIWYAYLFPKQKFKFHKHKLSHFPNVCIWMEGFVLSFCNQYHKTFEGPWCICCTMLIQNKTLF